MKRSHTQSVAHNHRTPMRVMTFVTGLGVLLITATGFPTVGLAQNDPPPQTDSRGTSLAPRTRNLHFRKAECRRRWGIVNRAYRTCHQASCARKAAKAVVSTRRGIWTRSWAFAKGADISAALSRAAVIGRRRARKGACSRSIACQRPLPINGTADDLPNLRI